MDTVGMAGIDGEDLAVEGFGVGQAAGLVMSEGTCEEVVNELG
jgi:hypothetical protein